jgi:H+/Cl- antiporter ClcA
MKKLLLSFIILLSSTSKALANPACALCTIAVGASLEIARRWGVDDCVVGVWAGAMLALIGYWMIIWFDKKNWHFKGRDFILIASSVAMIGAMYIKHMPYNPTNVLIFWIDPFLFSVILGALGLVYSSVFYQWMKARRGRANYPFEKVILPVMALVLLSAVFYYYPLCKLAQEFKF